MTLTHSTLPLDAYIGPDWWEFYIHVPGKPRAKGSQERKGKFLGERDIVMEWVAIVSAYAIQERRRREAQGDKSFPYEGNLKLAASFVYERPKVSALTKPTAKNNYGDLDKLLRSIGDALSPGEFWLHRQKVAKSAVIADDSLITEITARKAFVGETGVGQSPGAYIRLISV
jgi:Holliday junction resolvase RusA-like endonuclease